MSRFMCIAIDQVKAGDQLVADGGFTCIRKGAVLTVQCNPALGLWVPCRSGEHYLDGQVDDDGTLIGLVRPENVKAFALEVS